jgi:hypothetical protein
MNMGQTIIALGANAELIIEEPDLVPTSNRAVIITHAVAQAFQQSSCRQPGSIQGSVPIQIGQRLVRVYYELRIRRVLDALSAYSEAILHIKNNEDRYDRRLARKAIEVLRACYRAELR